MRQIVETFRATIECPKNRFKLYFPLDECQEWANSAGWYQVGIHGLDGGIFPHMWVKLTFREKMTEGLLDCKGTQTSVWSVFQNDMIQLFAKVMGYPLRAAVSCADENGVVEGWPIGSCTPPYRCYLVPDCQKGV